nr:60S ribosomal protein L27A [Cryptomonas sp.]
MPTDKKKTRKHRGHVSSGHGRIGKHRKHPGGRGKAGGQHHHRILFDKYHPDFFGKRGMRIHHKTRQKKYCPSINISKIAGLISGLKGNENNCTKELQPVNMLEIGAFKLLGKGKIPHNSFIIKGKFFSKKAEYKINKSGGVCVTVR